METVPTIAADVATLAASGPLSRSFIYEAIASGALKAGRIGRRRYVLLADWKAFLERGVATPIPAEESARLAQAGRRGRAKQIGGATT